ncbi:class I SAM-dependent methyltransferase [Halorientalis brevis]|uniref:Class I SAM-dependent methyltransferase n=1 Tax=Halorientalis brevis TaxID=1126241 RepID=A0ABD6C5L8_9EURY
MDSNEVRQEWAERSGEYSPEYYAYYGPDETSESIRSILDRFVARDASVLELGCSSGRHLAHLLDHGFENLAGIEVNGDAFDVMEETYPALADQGTFYHAAIEDVVGDFEDGQFDAVYSVETLQHLHPDVEWVFEEIARITDDLLVTVENEGGEDQSHSDDPDVNYVNDDFPLYYRDWSRVFTEFDFVEVDAEVGERDTVRTFRSA